MRRLCVFNNISLDGYFTDKKNDMSWAHENAGDQEFQAFVNDNAKGGGELVFGRITYEMMASFWPTPMAKEQMPEVAKQMNALPKVVFSKTLKEVHWNNTRLFNTDLISDMKKLKNEEARDMVIFGSGKIITQLSQHRLIDEYQFVINPLILGQGRTMFENLESKLKLKQTESRTFKNGNVFVRYSI